MKKLVGLFLLCFVLLCGKSWGENSPIELPMTVAATGKILVDIKVNGHPVTCIVDTGSPYFLLLDEVLVNQLKLEKIPVRVKLRFFAENQGGETYRTPIDTVNIGPLDYSHVWALTIDDIRRATGIGYQDLPNFWAQGILGMAFLENFHVKIDYPHNHFLLYPPDTIPPATFAAHWRPIGMASSSSERTQVPLLVDTGSTFSIISEQEMDPLGLRYQSVSGRDPLYKGLARVAHMTFQNLDLSDVTFEVANNFQHYSGHELFEGIFGYDYLKDVILDLDFPARKLSLEKP